MSAGKPRRTSTTPSQSPPLASHPTVTTGPVRPFNSHRATEATSSTFPSQSSSLSSQEQTALPFNTDVQDDILAMMAQEPTFLDAAVHWLEPSYFQGAQRREVASSLCDFYERYESSPTVGQTRNDMSMQGKFDGDEGKELLEYTNECYKRVAKVQEYTLDVVTRFAQTQAHKAAILDVLPLIDEGKWDEISTRMGEAQEVGNYADAKVYWLFEQAKQRAFQRTDVEYRAQYVIPTGIFKLDRIFRWGGPCRGEVGCLVAPTNGGKSIGLGHMARRAIYNNNKVFIATFEMAEDKYSDRMDASLTGVSMGDMMKDSTDFLEKIEPLAKRFARSTVVSRYPTGSASLKDVEKTLRVLKRRDGWVPDLILLDYAAIVKPSIKREKRYEEVQQVIQEFRAMCIKYNAVGWTAMQTTKSGESAYWIRGEHVATSWDSLADCDHVVSINATDSEKKKGWVRLFAIKIRDGIPKVKIGPLKSDWGRMQFVDVGYAGDEKPPERPKRGRGEKEDD